MCVVVQHHLGKGTRCAPPLHPPGLGSYWASNPSRASGTYHRSITRRAWRRPSPPAPNHGSSELSRSPEPHSKGDFALPAPIDLASVPAPKTPDHSMEATSSRPRRERFAATLPWNHPTEQRAFRPLATPTNRPPIGCRQRIGAEADQRIIAPP